MAITDEQFLDWLREDAAARTVLVHLYPYSVADAAVVTRRISNRPFIAPDNDSPPALQTYDDLLVGSPIISRRLNQELIGEAETSWGDIEIQNTNGDLDAWLDDYWDGRTVEVLIGDATWDIADFREVFAGVVRDVQVKDNETLSISIGDRRHILDRPVQTNLITGTGTVNDGEPVPLMYGYCYNVEPRLIDPATWKFRVHEGNVNSNSGGMRVVRDKGVVISATFSGTLWDGTFTLTAAADPEGRVTMDVRSTQTYLWQSAILEELLVGRGVLDSSEVDPDFFSDLFAEENIAGVAGYFIRDRKNVIDVLNDFSRSLLFWYGFSRAGLLTGGFIATSGAGSVTIDVDDVVEDGVRHIRRIMPWTSVRVGYKKNWTVQDPDSLAGAVTVEERAQWSAEFQGILAVDNVLDVGEHLTAAEPPLVPSFYEGAGAAYATGQYHSALNTANTLVGHEVAGTDIPGIFSEQRDVYELDCFAAGFDLELGDRITLDYPRYGFDGGAGATVVAITLRPLENRVTLEIWK